MSDPTRDADRWAGPMRPEEVDTEDARNPTRETREREAAIDRINRRRLEKMDTTTTTLAEYAAGLPAAFAANFGDRYTLVGFRPMTALPDDAYLFVVIGFRVDGDPRGMHGTFAFAEWSYNARAGGFGGGYYGMDLDRALERLRGVAS